MRLVMIGTTRPRPRPPPRARDARRGLYYGYNPNENMAPRSVAKPSDKAPR